jgi:hypothetical protein
MRTVDTDTSAVSQPARAGLVRRLAIPTGPSALDTWIARVLAFVAVVLVAACGIEHARLQPLYGPIDEPFHLAYVEKVATYGHPPIYGRDFILMGLQRHAGPHETKLPAPRPGSAPLPINPQGLMAENEAIQPPLYYYALAPVTWLTRWDNEVVVLRSVSGLFMAVAVALLYLAVRETVPRLPLAAGLAAIVLGTMGGLVQFYSQLQNDALLIAVGVLMLLLFVRDLNRRRATVWLALVGGLACVTQVGAAPGAALTLLAAIVVALRSRRANWREALRFSWPLVAVFVAPTALWLAFNIAAYHSLLPRDLAAAPAPSHANWLIFAAQTTQLFTAATQALPSLWLRLAPAGVFDYRPLGALAWISVIALPVALLVGAIQRVRVALGLWMALGLVWFASMFEVLLYHGAQVGGGQDYPSRYFGTSAAAMAAVIAILVVAALSRWAWVSRGVVVAIALWLCLYALQDSSFMILQWPV